MRSEFSHWGIRWYPRRYHSRPRLFATAWDMTVLLVFTLFFSWRHKPSHIHCRSYIPAMVAWLNLRLTGVPYIFDMRAIWPEEMVTAGRLRRGSWLYCMIRWIERRLLRDAAQVVSLTEAAVNELRNSYPELDEDCFSVITTCVDVSRFSVPPHLQQKQSFPDAPVVGTMGTLLSGWFYLDAFFKFFLAIKSLRPGASVFIVTRDDHELVRQEAFGMGVAAEDLSIIDSSPDDMPENLAKMDMAVMFYAPDSGRAPTRLAEFLAAGVPVVGNAGVGDLDHLIKHCEVGTVVQDVYSEKELNLAAEQIASVYPTITARGNCRRSAVQLFSADEGARHYRTIYKKVSLARVAYRS